MLIDLKVQKNVRCTKGGKITDRKLKRKYLKSGKIDGIEQKANQVR